MRTHKVQDAKSASATEQQKLRFPTRPGSLYWCLCVAVFLNHFPILKHLMYQPFTYPEENTVSSVFCNFFIFYIDVLFCLFSLLRTSHSFRYESAFHFFCFALFFFCTSLINFCYFICFLYLCIFLSHIFKHTKFLQLNSIYISMRFNL